MSYFAPYNGATYQLNDSAKLDKSIETMRSHQKVTLGPLQYFLIAFLRLLWFDWWVDKICDIKYRVQVSQWWRAVHNWKLVLLLDAIWTYPKQFVFDNKSDERCEMSEKARNFLKLQHEQTPRSQCAGNKSRMECKHIRNGTRHSDTTSSMSSYSSCSHNTTLILTMQLFKIIVFKYFSLIHNTIMQLIKIILEH